MLGKDYNIFVVIKMTGTAVLIQPDELPAGIDI